MLLLVTGLVIFVSSSFTGVSAEVSPLVNISWGHETLTLVIPSTFPSQVNLITLSLIEDPKVHYASKKDFSNRAIESSRQFTEEDLNRQRRSLSNLDTSSYYRPTNAMKNSNVKQWAADSFIGGDIFYKKPTEDARPKVYYRRGNRGGGDNYGGRRREGNSNSMIGGMNKPGGRMRPGVGKYGERVGRAGVGRIYPGQVKSDRRLGQGGIPNNLPEKSYQGPLYNPSIMTDPRKRLPIPNNLVRGGTENEDRPYQKHKYSDLLRISDDNNILALKVSDETKTLTVNLRRGIKTTDYIRGKERNIKGRIFYESRGLEVTLLQVVLEVVERFDCVHVTQNLCFIPLESLKLRQFENRPSSTLLELPSAKDVCEHMQTNLTVVGKTDLLMTASDRLSLTTRGLIDREVTDTSNDFTLRCRLEDSSLFSVDSEPTRITLVTLDENDTPPTRLGPSSVSWNMHNNHDDLDELLMIVDADEDTTSNYSVYVRGSANNLIVMESVNEFSVKKDLCRNLSKQHKVTPLFNASCTFVSPVLQFNEQSVPAGVKQITFSIIYEDKTLLPGIPGRTTSFDISLSVPLVKSPSEDDEDNIIIVTEEDITSYLSTISIINATVNRPVSLYSRLTQIIPRSYAASMLKYHKYNIKTTTSTTSPTIPYYINDDPMPPSSRRAKSISDLPIEEMSRHEALVQTKLFPNFDDENSSESSEVEGQTSKIHNAQFELTEESVGLGVSVTTILGIVYVSNVDQLMAAIQQAKRGVRIHVVRTDFDAGGKEETFEVNLKWSQSTSACFDDSASDVSTPENLPAPQNLPACSSIIYGSICESTCGLGATSLGAGACQWRPYNGTYLSKHYGTCSPDLSTCPDAVCDELERLDRRICPQDCTTKEHMQDTSHHYLNEGEVGIAVGLGVCSCDDFKCTCFPAEQYPSKNNDNELDDQHQEDAVGKESYVECNFLCKVVLVSFVIFVFFIICVGGILLFTRCRPFWRAHNKHGSISLGALSPEYMDDRSSSLVTGGHSEAHTTALHAVNGYHPQQMVSRGSMQTFSHEIMAEFLPVSALNVDQAWEFPRSNLTIEETLGEGEFGKVMKAKALDICNVPGFTTVAVKMLKPNSTAAELGDLLSEYRLLKDVNHPNVIKLMGACTSKGGPIYLIIEFCKYGALRNYLRRSRHYEFEERLGSASQDSDDYDVQPTDLLSFAWQIAKGMSYLTSMKLVHRDLAARNVLVASDKVCKISDFGLTRDIYADELYFKKSKSRVPVKWMAPESLIDHVYTSKSDVWGFGVLLWELVNLGSTPYPGVSLESLYDLLKSGYRMDKPRNCSQELYEVMLQCWDDDPNRRPNFAQLTDNFEKMITDKVEYLEVRSLMVTNRTYFGEDSTMVVPAPHQFRDGEEFEDASVPHIQTVPIRSSPEDAYLEARRDDDASAPLMNSTHDRVQVHNPAYFPMSASGTGSRKLPVSHQLLGGNDVPRLHYSTIDNSNNDEDYIKDIEPSDGGSDECPGDSGYITEEGKRNSLQIMNQCEGLLSNEEKRRHSSGATPLYDNIPHFTNNINYTFDAYDGPAMIPTAFEDSKHPPPIAYNRSASSASSYSPVLSHDIVPDISCEAGNSSEEEKTELLVNNILFNDRRRSLSPAVHSQTSGRRGKSPSGMSNSSNSRRTPVVV